MKKLLILIFIFNTVIVFANDRALYLKKYSGEQKTALIIGNSNYKHFSKLKNSINDARDMRKTLKAKGFDVLYLKDGSLRDMKKIVRRFTQKLKSGGVGFFYYAGHGIEVDGHNYLIPVNADIPDKNEVEYESLSMNMVIDKIEDSSNRLNIIALDACRNDPFSRGGGGGLAQINNAKGMYVAYATAPGNVASDGSGRNGLFTKYLIKNINKENLELNRVFKNVRIEVNNESDGKQLPWTSSSVIGDFFFNIKKEYIQKTINNTNYKKQIGKHLLGIWNLKWKGKMANYTGFLQVHKKISKNEYTGKLYLEFYWKEQKITLEEDALITVRGDDIEVNCSNPTMKKWNNDNFFLALDGNYMFGYSKDAKGKIGKQIKLWKE